MQVKFQAERVANVKKMVRDICTTDLDRDGRHEVIVGSMDRTVRAYTLRGEHIYTVRMHDWVSVLVPLEDGRVLAADRSGNVIVISPEGTVECMRELNTHVYSSIKADVDDDGEEEILLGANGATFVLDAKLNIKAKVKGQGIAAAFAIDEEKGTVFIGHFGGLLKRWCWKGREKKWYFGESIYTLLLADIDDDGSKELVVGGRPPHVVVLDYELREVVSRGTKASVLSLAVFESAWGRSLLIGTRAGHFFAIRVRDFREVFVRTLGQPITQLIIEDVDRDGTQELIMLNWTVLRIIDPRFAQVCKIEFGAEWIRRMRVCDVDADALPEILLGLSNGDVYLIDQA